MDLVLADTRFKYELSDKDVANQLNSWTSDYEAETDWQPTSLLETLPEDVQNSPLASRVGELRFTPTDAIYIQESAWAREVVRWAIDRQSPGDFRYLIDAAKKKADEEQKKGFAKSRNLLRSSVKVLHADVPAEVADEKAAKRGANSELDKLTQSVKLFDWVVRYVQLLPTVSTPNAEQVREQALVRNAKIAASAGVSGPGYQRQPWHLFTSCVGDAQERGRLFIRLLREARIPAVMLAVPDREDSEVLLPWCVGVLIDEQLYLFDMQLGLPIPGPDSAGIATLADARTDKSLLSDLDLTARESLDDIDYPVLKSQLDGVVALIDASEEAVSKRMAELKPQLSREQRMELTVDVDALAKQIRAVDGVSDVRMWEVPFYAAQFRVALESARLKGLAQLRFVGDLQRENLLEMKLARISENRNDKLDLIGLSEARHRYLTGRFAAEKNSRLQGAAEMFANLQVSEKAIAGFDTNDEWKTAYGLTEQASMSFVDYKRALENVKVQLRLISADATFYLGQTHYEHRNTSNAVIWYQTYLDRGRNGNSAWQLWRPSARYMEGRCNESLREFDEAFAAYTDESYSGSPQFFGNVIRARLLKKWSVK